MIRQKLLIVEDEPEIREMLIELLSPHFEIFSASDGEEGSTLADLNVPDLILLDLRIPKMDGIALCEHLRGTPKTRDIPIIFLTGNDELDSRVRAFGAGADDFISKPFIPEELIARLQSKARRNIEKTVKPSVLQCGNLTANLNNLEVKIADQTIILSVLQFDLLKCFLEHANQLLSREKIVSIVWQDSVVSPRTVDVHIMTLRNSLEGFDHSLDSVYGGGYILRPPQTNIRPRVKNKSKSNF